MSCSSALRAPSGPDEMTWPILDRMAASSSGLGPRTRWSSTALLSSIWRAFSACSFSLKASMRGAQRSSDMRISAPTAANCSSRCGRAALLEGRFPRHVGELPRQAVDYLAQQLRVAPDLFASYAWSGRTIEYHRAQARAALGLREATGHAGGPGARGDGQRGGVEAPDPDDAALLVLQPLPADAAAAAGGAGLPVQQHRLPAGDGRDRPAAQVRGAEAGTLV